MTTPVLVVGCGYTGERVARRLLIRGVEVHATTRDPSRLAALAALGARIHRLEVEAGGGEPQAAHVAASLPEGLAVLISVPPITSSGGAVVDPVPALLGQLEPRMRRAVYLSTTGVHGATAEVDESTPPAPQTPADEARLSAERAVLSGPWRGLVLRPAAIYGPHRGAHVLVRTGALARMARTDRVVSRVYVDDLAALCDAALSSELGGAFPVADDEPASTIEVARFAARLLGVPEPVDARDEGRSAAPREGVIRGDRRVDGRAVRRLLGVALRHPTYREGIAAALRAEQEAGEPVVAR